MIGDRTAEEVKIAIGSALPLDEPLQMEVKGRDMIAGLPRTIPITSTEITEAIEQPLPADHHRRAQRPGADAAGAVAATSSTRAW